MQDPSDSQSLWRQRLDEHGGMVWATVYRILNHGHDAEEVYQEVFVEAVRYERRHEVMNWGAMLRRIAVNRAIDRLRLNRRRARVSGSADGLMGVEGSVGVRACVFEGELAWVRDAVGGLPEAQSRAIVLCCVEGLTYEQAGEVMGKSSRHVGVLVHRARKRLRQQWEQTYESKPSSISK